MNTCFTKSYLLVLSALATMPALAAVTQLDDVVVTATRIAQPAREVIGDVTVLDREAIAAQGTSSLQDVLARQPGIQISNSGGPGKATSIFMRGTNNGQTLVLIDGIAFGSATLGSASLQNIPLNQIDRIEILRGPAASLYGSGAIGGVIQIFTRQGSAGFKPSVEVGYGNYNTLDAKASLGGGNDSTSYALTVAHFQTDGTNAIVNPKHTSFYADDDGYTNTSLSFSAQHKINQDHQVGLSALGAWGENHYDGSYLTKSYKNVAQSYDYRDESFNGSGNVWLKSQFTPIWQSKLQAGLSVDDGKSFTPVSEKNYADVTNKIKTQQNQLSWMNDLKLLGGNVQLGLETLEQEVSGDTQFAVDQRRINSALAGYLLHYADFTMQLNGRSDDNSQYGRQNTGTVGLSYQLNDDWVIGSTMGTAFKAPSFNDLYWPKQGNPNLKPEDANSKEAFIRFANNNFKASLTGYYNKVNNLIAWAPTSTGEWLPSNIGEAQLKGITLTSDWQADIYTAGFSYDYLNAEDTTAGSKTYGKQLARRAKNSGLVYAGLQTAVWTARIEVEAQGQRYNDAANKQALAGYGLTNIAASWQFAKDWSLHARVNNLFDKEYQTVTDYGTLGVNGLLSVRWSPK